MARRIKKNGAYGSNLRVIDAFYNANRIEEVTVASDKPNSVTKLVNADMASEVKLQPSASETYTANGTYILEPYPTKDAIEQATITVAIPLEEEKTTTINVEDYTNPIEVTPSSGKTAMEKNTITLTGIPTIEDNKSTTINLSSYSEPVEIVPSSGSDAMEKATVTITGIPVIQTNKAAAISVQDYDPSSKPIVEPDDGYDAMAQSTITLTGLPEIKPMELATIDVSTYSDTVTVAPTGGYDAMEEAAITLTGIPTTEADKSATIDVSTYDPANKPVITPTSGYDTMAQSTVTLTNVPVLEANKSVTIDASQYTVPVEITPTSGSDAMEKVTVTLTNPGTHLYAWTLTNAASASMMKFTTFIPTSSDYSDGDTIAAWTCNNVGLTLNNSGVNTIHGLTTDQPYILHGGDESHKYYRNVNRDVNF